eukprot:m.511602 g.511602  ORF g.511602 m.511602 type:complete len:1116 (-) comp57429_c0_seq1:250-3597(-)
MSYPPQQPFGGYAPQFGGARPPFPGPQPGFTSGFPAGPQQPGFAPQGAFPPQGHPQQQGYAPGPQQGFAPGPQQGYAPAPQPGYAPAPQPGYPPQPQQGYNPQPQQQGYGAPQPGPQPGFPPQQGTQPGYAPQGQFPQADPNAHHSRLPSTTSNSSEGPDRSGALPRSSSVSDGMGQARPPSSLTMPAPGLQHQTSQHSPYLNSTSTQASFSGAPTQATIPEHPAAAAPAPAQGFAPAMPAPLIPGIPGMPGGPRPGAPKRRVYAGEQNAGAVPLPDPSQNPAAPANPGPQAPGAPQPYPGQQYPGQAQQFPGQAQQFPGQSPQFPGQPGPYPTGAAGPLNPPGPPAKKGIDPDAVPSPLTVAALDQEKFHKQVYQTSSRSNPPLTSTLCPIVDDGNCSPHVVRSTLYNIPCSDELATTAKVPLALVLQPLADIGTESNQIPVVDHGPTGPVRCSRCKAYMCPAVLFIDGGRRYQCNFCQTVNDVPESYFCHLDHTGRRRDIDQRPELTHGTIEYAAPKEYTSRDPKVPSVVFVLDVSYVAVQSGSLAASTQAIREALNLYTRPGVAVPKVAIITYDKSVHFYNLSATLAQPQMLIVSDVDDVFLPLSQGIAVDPVASREMIETLLNQIPGMYSENKATEPVFGAAVQAAYLAAKDTGGRVVVFQSGLPNSGPGKLKKRDDPAALGTPKEKLLYAPQDSFYTKLAKDCVQFGVSVDLFVFPTGYIDVATMGELVSLTSGSLFRYPFFKPTNDTAKLVWDLRKSLGNLQGVEGMLRVRCSTGLRAVDYYGALLASNTSDVEIAGLDKDHAIVVKIKHDNKLAPNSDAHFQVAVLYTTLSGERRIRVHTLSLRVCSDLADVFRGADMDAITNSLCKMALKDISSLTLTQIREKLTNQCVAVLTAYRKHCTAPNSGPGQLILPECLKLLPLYTGCLLRSPMFRSGGDMSVDDRVAAFKLAEYATVTQLVPFLYPRLFAVHDVLDDETGLPASMRPSYERLRDTGAYLLDDGASLFLWLGKNINPQWLFSVLGASNFQTIDPHISRLPVNQNGLSARVRSIVDAVTNDRNQELKLTVIKQKDPIESLFMRYLVEDKMQENPSYVDYLCLIHREIQLGLQ